MGGAQADASNPELTSTHVVVNVQDVARSELPVPCASGGSPIGTALASPTSSPPIASMRRARFTLEDAPPKTGRTSETCQRSPLTFLAA